MEGRRVVSSSPRPCSGRRVLAKKRPRVDGFVNSVKKLQRREICSKRDRAFSMSNAQERFRNIGLQEEYDTHDPKGHCPMVLPFLKKRSKIIEIVAARDIVFALAQSGVCAAFSRETNQRICFLNVSPDEVIRSLFYNKNNDSLITVSVYASDNFSSLKCRTTRIEYIRRGKPDAGFALFESESLKWPGFVEFDDVNGKVLTYSAQDSIYKVFDLKNYTMLYSISDKNVQEIKIREHDLMRLGQFCDAFVFVIPGIMLLIFTRAGSHVPLKILSIEDGTVLKSFNHLLHRNKKVDFIEQFNEKLLVKQEDENLQILDVRNAEFTEVSRMEFMTPSAFIFLYENQLFLTFRNRTVAVWNFRGELVTSFEDHLLWHPDCNTNNIYITSDQDLIISYCKADSDDPLEGSAGSINISNILTGKCLAKIRATSDNPKDENSDSSDSPFPGRMKKRLYSGRIRNTVAEALEDITALFYDEERNEIYTGNRQGLVHCTTSTSARKNELMSLSLVFRNLEERFSKRNRASSLSNAPERFRNIGLQEEYDTHDPKGHCPMALPILKKRSKVVDIVAAHDIVFALAQTGVCAAFSRETNQRICFVNVSPDEVIRSLFYNKNNDSLLVASVYASDNFSSLKCRSTRIEDIQRGKPDAGFALFESESLK
ncbi:hypothetical protein C5167_002254 [Papaver somniferum]|uniref:Transducin/WD40 repeat-like superfamily protein n=2 Tax=Papaver TaxID=3468 RepID=A0A4Y7L1B9_PAPSO|nr:hypothetical protein C5167_002254 [Papaver somniferum]